MYVILTSKPGQFRTEIGDVLQPVETYDYLFCGRKRAQFVIAQLSGDVKVRIVDESTPPVVNLVPSKFLPSFDDLIVHPTINIDNLDPQCDIPGLVINQPKVAKRVCAILNNSFGMLGINSTLIIKRFTA